ncbi:hypothetical protein ACFQJC_04785 [Haloferax namakaokahaiae]|uniref:Uncharacterized protein n=1 Tax=Haloferax namakaokahaiae TaxID=1748331 RepID=A0ABD5ZCE0_9EURY
MSKAPSINPNDEAPSPDDPVEIIEENRELFERVAAADVTISDRVQRALDYADNGGEIDDE